MNLGPAQARLIIALGGEEKSLQELAVLLYGKDYTLARYSNISATAAALVRRGLLLKRTLDGRKYLRLPGASELPALEEPEANRIADESQDDESQAPVLEAMPDWMPGGLLGEFCRLVGWTPEQGVTPGHFFAKPSGHRSIFSVAWESGAGLVMPHRWRAWDKASRAHLWAVLVDLGHSGSRLAGDAFVWLAKLPSEPWSAPSWGAHESPIRAWLQGSEEHFPRWPWPFEGALFVPVEPRRIRGEWAPRPGWPMLKSGSLKPVTLGEPFTPGKVSGWTFDKGLGTFVRVTPESAPAASG